MKRTLFTLLLTACVLSLEAATINLLEAGGKNDGVTLNTTAINDAIEQLCTQGGGTLYIPAGTYLTGPITLKSHLTLHLEAGAVLRFTDDFDAYLPYVEMRYEGVVMRSFQPLLYAYEAEHITIKGEGTLDGNGKAWWFAAWGFDTGTEKKRDLSRYQTLWNQANADLTIEDNSDWKGTLARRFFRPPFFQAYKSKHIRIEGVTFVNSPFWTINPEFCDNVTVSGITINNPPSPNTDGVNPSSCSNVHISDCHISVGDDCVTIKSGRDAQGRRYATPCQNITITNCTMLSGHGGVVIGSETSGGVKGVVISNCLFDGTDRGIRIKSTRGRGGVVEDIRVSNIVMRNIGKEAITINQYYSKVPEEPVSERTPICRNIHISGLTGVNVQTAGTLLGLPEMPLNGITLRDIDIQAKQGLQVSDATNLALSDVILTTTTGPSISLLRVNEADASSLKERLPKPNAPLLKVEACENLYVTGCNPLPGSTAFLELTGNANRGLVLQNNQLTRLKHVVIPAKAWSDAVLKVVGQESAQKKTASSHVLPSPPSGLPYPASAYASTELKVVLDQLASRFGVRLKVPDNLVAGKSFTYAPWRIVPWSVEESLTQVLAPFDLKWVKEFEGVYKIKEYEYARRTPAYGQAFLTYLSGLYADQATWEARKDSLKEGFKQALGLSPMPQPTGKPAIVVNKRIYKQYSVENVALEVLPGVFTMGNVYKPLKPKRCPVIINPIGHFPDDHYYPDIQRRCAMQASMGAIVVSYNLFGWGESMLQFDYAWHRTDMAQTIQTLNAIRWIDYLTALPEADPSRVGITGASGGGSQSMMVTAIDDRITCCVPVVMTSSWFVGGCPCESGRPVHLCGGGTNNAEVAAMCAPRPLLIVSDGKDWTSEVPWLEYPFIQRIYGFYNSLGKVENAHFAEEGHDYGPSKRQVAYRFLAKHLALDSTKVQRPDGTYDESAVVIEPKEAMYVFGPKGERFPAHAVKDLATLEKVLEAAKQHN